MTTSKSQDCALCGSTEDVATKDCRVCGRTLAALCDRCYFGFEWQTTRGWLDRAKALMDLHGCRRQQCNERHDRRYECHSEECHSYPATIERESIKLRAMRKGLDGLSWGFWRAVDEYDQQGKRDYSQRMDQQKARIAETENYIIELQQQAAESNGK